jgi:probable F420-dependent oxidoreductase
MKYGVVFPQTEFGNDRSAIKDYAQTAEELGYDYLLVYDHVLGAHPDREPRLTGPYTNEHPFHEPMVFFGFLAAITERMELVTGILILPQRQTALVAKQTAEIDVLSGGRLRLGIGIGWNYVEYAALGEDFHTRGRRVEEQIEVLRKLWTQPLITHKSAQHVIDNAGISPMPIQQPIPIWFGGVAEAVLKRAARLGDGWMPAGRPPDDRVKVHINRLHEYLEEAGRDPKSFGIDPWISIAGLDKDEWRRRVEAWRGLGASHVAVDTMRAGFTSPQAHIDAIRSFRDVLD